MSLQRVWDDDTNRFIFVDVLYSGGSLPWQRDDDPRWAGTGSLSDVVAQGHKRQDFPTDKEVRGKGLAGTSWREPNFATPQASGRRPYTRRAVCGCGRSMARGKRDCRMCKKVGRSVRARRGAA